MVCHFCHMAILISLQFENVHKVCYLAMDLWIKTPSSDRPFVKFESVSHKRITAIFDEMGNIRRGPSVMIEFLTSVGINFFCSEDNVRRRLLSIS